MDVQRAHYPLKSILYNDEFCYQITLRPSKVNSYTKIFLPLIVAALATLLLTSVSFFSQFLFFIITAVVLFIWQKVRSTYRRFSCIKKTTLLDGFLLTPTGNCTLKNIFYVEKQQHVISIIRQLNCRSRVSFLGCWLYFEKDRKNIVATTGTPIFMLPQPWFIFRDSLSKQDFSRLARVINSLSIIQHKKNNKQMKNN